MQAQQNPAQYKLNLEVETPPTVVEGETFNIVYRVRNVGTSPFPGGHVTVEISWPSLDPKVYQPIVISNPLALNQEFVKRGYSQAPLVAGYTWFHVYQAAASNGVPVVVLKGPLNCFLLSCISKFLPHRQLIRKYQHMPLEQELMKKYPRNSKSYCQRTR